MTSQPCPICGSPDTRTRKRNKTVHDPTPKDFRITDDAYGATGPLTQCGSCGFLFVVYPRDASEYYAEMEDPTYERGRSYRAIQLRRMVTNLQRIYPGMRTLLDVGAGTGMLVEQAMKMGLDAVGVEPSQWCCRLAKDQGLPVLQGTLPHPELAGKSFDAITAIDVIEHVNDPMALLKSCRRYLKPGAAMVLVTPDVESVAARWLGHRWWHYRIAHVGYFSKKTLAIALEKTGFTIRSVRRPAWYFEWGYVYRRLRNYMPLPKPADPPGRVTRWLFSRIIRVNLRDSLEVIACAE